MSTARLLPALLCAAMFLPALYLGYGVQRSDFGPLVLSYGVWFALYAFVLWRWGHVPECRRLLLGTGVLLRVAMVFGMPLLSDDVYRFIWDGRLWAAGFHPFLYTPREFLEMGLSAPGADAGLMDRLNSPDYHTVYPPLAQAVFYLSARAGTASLWPGVLVIKCFLLACELGTVYLLYRRFPTGVGALLYVLNPLPILEICGNAHFEGAAVFFVLLAVVLLQARVWIGAASALSMAVAAKLVPLLFVPFFIRYLGWRKGLLFGGVFGLFCLLLFAPMLTPDVVRNMASSLDLYFQKFAFNAGLFYIFWEIGLVFKQYTMDKTLGPLMALFAAGGILYLAWKLQKGSIMYFMLAASLWHLLWSSTVHPWYLCLPLIFSTTLGTLGKHIRHIKGHNLMCLMCFPNVPNVIKIFALGWSGTVILSYSHYANGRFQENYTMIALEYLLPLMVAFSLSLRLRNNPPCSGTTH